MSSLNNPDHPVILFIPEAGIYPFTRGLAVLGDAIKKQGGKVLITHDSGQMLRSPIMSMYRTSTKATPKERARVKKATDKILKMVSRKYGFPTIELSDFVDEKLMKEISDLVNVPENELESLSFRGFPVGKMAQYDFALETKFTYYKNLSEEHKALYLVYIKNTALTIAITDSICEQYKPSLLLTFNEYAQCQAVRYSAKTHNVSRMALTYPVHLNIDASRFSIWNTTFEYWIYKHCQNWDSGKDFPISPQHVKDCWNDAVFRTHSSGSNIWSSQKSNDPAFIFEKLKLNPKKKTLVAYTSSRDERVGIDIAMNIWKEDNKVTDAFKNQIEWLLMLQEYSMKRKDIQVVVRIHPREGLRGQGFSSAHLKELKSVFAHTAPDFIIVWPDDAISSYDLMELADVCLVSWSLVSQEAARLGIPALAYTGNMFYPDDDFIQVATTPEEYEKRLDSIIDMKYTWQHLTKAVRFYHWRTFVSSLDLGETVSVDIQDDTFWPEAPTSKIGAINDILSGQQDLIKYNLEKWRSNLSKNAIKEEAEAIRQGIRYFLDKIFYPPAVYGKKMVFMFRVFRKIRKILLHLFGKKVFTSNLTEYDFTDYQLEFSPDTVRMDELCEKTKQNTNLRILVGSGLNAILIHNGKLIHRTSPMVVKLAKLYSSSIKD